MTVSENRLPILSCEVFPPKKEVDYEKIYGVLDAIAEIHPAFISVTYGAGGSNAGKHLEIASYIQNHCGCDAIAHITCVGFRKDTLAEELGALSRRGIHEILALRGDRPVTMTDEEYQAREFQHAVDMIRFIREGGYDYTIAGACYPEKHPEAPDEETDLRYLKEKTDAGCDYLISQLFFTNEVFLRFVEKARDMGITVPIHAGIMPITSANQLGRTVKLSGTSVPKELSDLIARYGDHPADMKKAGLDFAVRQAVDLADRHVDGIHVYAMNRPEHAREIFEAVRHNDSGSGI